MNVRKYVYNAKDASCGRYMPLPSLCSIVNAHAMQSSLSSFSTPAAFSERYDMTIDTPLRPPPQGRRAGAGTGKITKYRGAIGMSDIEKKTIANHVKSQNPEQTACRRMFQRFICLLLCLQWDQLSVEPRAAPWIKFSECCSFA